MTSEKKVEDTTTQSESSAEAVRGAKTALRQLEPKSEPKPEAKPAEMKPAGKPPVAESKTAPAVLPPAPVAAAPAVRRYRVWPHGTLQRNGTTYEPGAELTMAEAEAATIVCLEPVG